MEAVAECAGCSCSLRAVVTRRARSRGSARPCREGARRSSCRRTRDASRARAPPRGPRRARCLRERCGGAPDLTQRRAKVFHLRVLIYVSLMIQSHVRLRSTFRVRMSFGHPNSQKGGGYDQLSNRSRHCWDPNSRSLHRRNPSYRPHCRWNPSCRPHCRWNPRNGFAMFRFP